MASAKDATILWPAQQGGEMAVLRKGTNNWPRCAGS
jgi:hypothetical protein